MGDACFGVIAQLSYERMKASFPLTEVLWGAPAVMCAGLGVVPEGKVVSLRSADGGGAIKTASAHRAASSIGGVSVDRITRVIIKNVRAIEHLELELGHPMTVLIGENGSGKSTIIECLEVLRKAGTPGFMRQFYSQHRGMPGLLRRGALALELGVVIENDASDLPRIEYRFALEPRVAGAAIAYERLLVGSVGSADKPRIALQRSPDRGELFDQRAGKLVPVPNEAMKPDQLVISSFGNLPPQEAIERLLAVLLGVEVHLPFDTVASWVAKTYQFSRSIRSSTMLLPAERLDLLGFNLANAWSELKNRSSIEWEALLGLVRLGLGDHIDTVQIKADPRRWPCRTVALLQGACWVDPGSRPIRWAALLARLRFDGPSQHESFTPHRG